VKLRNLVIAGGKLFALALTLILVINCSGIVSAVGLGSSKSISSSGMIFYTPQNTTLGWLHTVGNKIENSAGQVVELTGACTEGLQGDYGVYWDNGGAQTHQLYDTLHYYNANTVRVAINIQMAWASQNALGSATHGYSQYWTTLIDIANYCGNHSLWVIWDFHDDYYNGTFYGCGGADWNFNDNTWKTRVQNIEAWFAKQMENYTSVIGIEIVNEPSTNPVYEQPSNPAEISAFNTLASWEYNVAHAIHTADGSRTAHYLVFIDGEEDSTTFADWTANGNKFLNSGYWGTPEPNIVYVYHWYGWEFGFWTPWVAEYAAGNYAQAKTDMTTFYQNRFWYVSTTYNEPIWYGEFGFAAVNTYNGTTIQQPQLDQLIKDICAIHNAQGISWSIFVMHTTPAESIINSFTASPTSMFNFKGQDAAPYFVGAY
jgi:hypothetical protein